MHTKKQAIELLQQHKPGLQNRFGVVCLAILVPTAQEIAISKLLIRFYAHKKDNVSHFYAHKSVIFGFQVYATIQIELW